MSRDPALIFRPHERWERSTDVANTRSQFTAPYEATRDLLLREVRMLGAPRVIVELAIKETDLRQDQQPYAHTKPAHPGVIVAFESCHGPLKYTVDRFADWRENLRAIGLALKALRMVDRYGVTHKGEQYAGWKQLPSGENSLRDRGDELIREHGSVPQALKATHPDHGGDPDDFRAVQAAREQAGEPQ
jgi:hypothetical protein